MTTNAKANDPETSELALREKALDSARKALSLARRTLEIGYGEKLDAELEEALKVAERFARGEKKE